MADGPKGGATALTRKPGPRGDPRDLGRGINLGLNTRLYFGDEDNAADPVLNLIEQDHRRRTLIAEKTADGVYRFDIRLQGDNETVFLDV